MAVRKKLTEAEGTSAFVIGGGITLFIVVFFLAAAQASPTFNTSLLSLVMLIGGTLVVVGTIAWMLMTQPWQNFDDWSTPLYTGHDHGHVAHAADHATDHASDHGAVQAEAHGH